MLEYSLILYSINLILVLPKLYINLVYYFNDLADALERVAVYLNSDLLIIDFIQLNCFCNRFSLLSKYTKIRKNHYNNFII